MTLKTTKWDVQDYLKTEEQIAAYLDAVVEENDPALLTKALMDAAKARGMSRVAKQIGISRVGLYKALAKGANPSFETVSKIAGAFDLRIGLVRAGGRIRSNTERHLKRVVGGKLAKPSKVTRI